MLKHLVGLTLFAALCTMLLALGSYWAPLFVFLVATFVISQVVSSVLRLDR